VWDSRAWVVQDTRPSRVSSETAGAALRAGVGGVGDAAVLMLNARWAGGGVGVVLVTRPFSRSTRERPGVLVTRARTREGLVLAGMWWVLEGG
jgi:hypothetical protein